MNELIRSLWEFCIKCQHEFSNSPDEWNWKLIPFVLMAAVAVRFVIFISWQECRRMFNLLEHRPALIIIIIKFFLLLILITFSFRPAHFKISPHVKLFIPYTINHVVFHVIFVSIADSAYIKTINLNLSQGDTKLLKSYANELLSLPTFLSIQLSISVIPGQEQAASLSAYMPFLFTRWLISTYLDKGEAIQRVINLILKFRQIGFSER